LHKSYAINVFAVLNMANQRPKMTIIWKNWISFEVHSSTGCIKKTQPQNFLRNPLCNS
jgi:hypothetical protein